MMNMKRMIATNKGCTYIMMTAFGAALGMTIAKTLIESCCCKERLKCKAKRAFQAMEDSILD